MPVITAEIESLQGEISEQIEDIIKELSGMEEDFKHLNDIIMVRTVDQIDGTVTESLPQSRDDPTRSVTEKDRQSLFNYLFEKYIF